MSDSGKQNNPSSNKPSLHSPSHGESLNRFVSKFLIGDGCWEWLAGKNNAGYGYFWFNGKQRRAHKVCYEMLRGPVPDGLVLDHSCRNKACVNPDHLQAVPQFTNVIRGEAPTKKNFFKTTCAKGHPYERYEKTGFRYCRKCKNEKDLARYHSQKGKA